MTSDEYITNMSKTHDSIEIKPKEKKKLLDELVGASAGFCALKTAVKNAFAGHTTSNPGSKSFSNN